MNVNSRMSELRTVPHEERDAVDLFLEVRLWLVGQAKLETSSPMRALRELLRRADDHAEYLLAELERDPERTLLEILCPDEEPPRLRANQPGKMRQE